MSVIWKFPLQPLLKQDLELPAGADILSAQWQASSKTICLWAACHPDEWRRVKWTIWCVPTGTIVPDEVTRAIYVSTVQTLDGLVFHLFRQYGGKVGP